jgi:perosamine synthetase
MKKLKKNISYGSHYIDQKDIRAVVKVLKSKNITQGPYIEAFEKKICKIVGSKYAVAVSSCTAGLHIACKALDFKKSSTLLTSAISFVSSSNVAYFLGGKSHLVDIKKDNSISLDINDLEKKIKKYKPLVVMPVHIGGVSYDYDKIKKLSNKYKFKIIEDAAHSFGGKYNNNYKIGSCKYSDMTVFSFHPIKTITTGEGGVVTTNNKFYYKKLLRLRSHGINKADDKPLIRRQAYTGSKLNSWYYEMRELGYHYRLTDIQAALGLSQLNKLNRILKKRRQVFQLYDREFRNTPIKTYQIEKRDLSSYHLYIIWIDFKNISKTRQDFLNYLKKNKIFPQIHYLPIFMHPYYKNLKKYKFESFPNSLKYYSGCLSLPCYLNLKTDEQKFIIKKIKNFLTN